MIERVAANKLRAVTLLGGKCIRCGYDRCIAALDFHHRDPDVKEDRMTRVFYRTWEKILIELEKCDLLCANCHREHHAGYSR